MDVIKEAEPRRDRTPGYRSDPRSGAGYASGAEGRMWCTPPGSSMPLHQHRGVHLLGGRCRLAPSSAQGRLVTSIIEITDEIDMALKKAGAHLEDLRRQVGNGDPYVAAEQLRTVVENLAHAIQRASTMKWETLVEETKTPL